MNLRALGSIALGLTLGGLPSVATAHPLSPRFVPIADGISPPRDGVDVEAERTGSMPRITVRVSGSRDLEMTGVHGEPFIRIDGRGAHVNASSPSAKLLDRAEQPRALTGARPPRWRRVSRSREVSWFEPRAEYPLGGPPPDVESTGKRATVFRWELPGTYGGEPVELRGHVDWVPAPFDPTIPLLAAGATLLVLIRFGPRFRRRAG